MKRNLDSARQATLSGICIGLGGAAYLKLGGLEGAVLFAFGLLSVVHYKLPLYTGMAGFFNYKSRIEYVNLFAAVLFNALGCFITAKLVGFEGQDVIFQRIEAGYFLCLCRSILCGIIMTIIVGAARKGNQILLIFGITLFIACGFYHSIADAFYMFSSLEDIELVRDYLSYWLVIIAGNFIGCNVPRLLKCEL